MSRSEKHSPWILLVILTIAAVLRASFVVGVNCADEPAYLGAVRNLLVTETWYPGDDPFSNRVGLIYPMAFFASIFGLSDRVLSLWPILCSLLEILVVYLIGARIGSRPIALVAAAILAIAPSHVLLASFILPDAVLALFLAIGGLGVVAAIQRIEQENSGNLLPALGAGLAIGFGYLTNPRGLFLLLPIFSFCLIMLRHSRRYMTLGLLVSLGVLAVLCGEQAVRFLAHRTSGWSLSEAIRLYSNTPPNMASLDYYPNYLLGADLDLPLDWAKYVVAAGLLTTLFIRPRGVAWRFIAVWLILLSGYLEFGLQSIDPIRPVSRASRYLAVVYAPSVLLTAFAMVQIGTNLGALNRWIGRYLLPVAVVGIAVAAVMRTVSTVRVAHHGWWSASPACGGCKYAARDLLLAMSSRWPQDGYIYVPEGPHSALFIITASTDSMLFNRLKMLTAETINQPKGLQGLAPATIVLGLDKNLFASARSQTVDIGSWSDSPPPELREIASIPITSCPEPLRARIFQVQ